MLHLFWFGGEFTLELLMAWSISDDEFVYTYLPIPADEITEGLDGSEQVVGGMIGRLNDGDTVSVISK